MYVKAIKKFCREYGYLLLLELLLLVLFIPLFRKMPLSGLDTPGHLHALTLLTRDFLPSGYFQGYDHAFFGGYPLFVSYAPLPFLILASIHTVFRFIPLFYLLRIFALVLVFLFPPLFYLFLKAFFGRKFARRGVLFSSFFLFYPKVYAFIGMGASSVFWAGLIPGFFGLLLLILFISSLEMYLEEGALFNFLLSILSLASLLLGHILSALLGLYFLGLQFLFNFNRRDKIKILQLLVITLAGFLISSFWLLPFILNLPFTSGSSSGISSHIADPFLLLYPLKPPVEATFIEFLYSYNWWSLFLLILSGIGLYYLVINNSWKLVSAFSILYLFVTRNILSTLFTLSIHYQRFLPFLFILMLAFAVYGFEQLHSLLSRRGKFLLFCLLFLCIMHQMLAYLSNAPVVHWSWDDYPMYTESRELTRRLSNKAIRSLFIQVPPDVAMLDLGSTHRLDHLISRETGIPVVLGLYAESATLTPYIMSLTEAFTRGDSQAWGDVALRSISFFYNRPLEYYLRRFSYLGISHILVYSNSIARALSLAGYSAEQVTPNFTLFETSKGSADKEDLSPLGVFVDMGGSPTFKDVALASFVGENTYSISLVEFPYNIKALRQSSLFEYTDFIIVSLPHSISSAMCNELKSSFSVPLYCISEDSFFSLTRDSPYKSQFPHSWLQLYDFLENVPSKEQAVGVLSSLVKSFRTLEVLGHGAIRIKMGYSPLWKIENCAGCELYRVSPSHVLLIIPGAMDVRVDLTFHASSRPLVLLSLSGLIVVVLGYFVLKKYVFLHD